MKGGCRPVPTGKQCPSTLRQATAESMSGVHEIVRPETLDERTMKSLMDIVRTVRARWREKLEGAEAQSVIAYVMGKWGYGKTHYGLYLEQLAQEQGLQARYILFNELIDLARRGGWRDPGELRERMVEELARNAGRDRPLIVILDEFESLVSAHWAGTESERLLVEAFIELYEALVNPRITYHSDLRGWLHLVLLLTPAASIKLEQLLDQAFKKGKIKTRYDFIVHLRPLPKDKTVLLVEEYLGEILGLRPRDLLARDQYINMLYYVTGGVPRILLHLLRELAREAEALCSPGARCCICRLSGKRLLSALARTTLVDPEGESYQPVTEFLSSIADSMSDDEVDLVLGLDPVDEKTAQRLSRYGIEYERVRAYGPLPASRVARWLDRISERLCAGRGECRDELVQALQHLIHYTGDGYIITLPEDPETLGEWLYSLGWTTGSVPRSLDVGEAGPEEPWKAAYAIPPRTLRHLYRSPIEGALDFIIDAELRQLVQARLDKASAEPGRLYDLAVAGLETILRLRGPVLVRGILVEDDLVYRYEEAGVVFHIPVEVASARGRSKKANSIVVTIARGTPGTRVEGARVVISPREADTRLLAAIALALEQADNPARQLDLPRLDELARAIIEAAGLEEALAAAAQGLARVGVVVRPMDHSDVFRGTSVDERFRALGDVLKFLAVLGGKTRYVPVSELTWFLWLLAYITPYGRPPKRKWCGISYMEIGRYSDIKDPESRERLEKLVTSALAALTAEGLVAKAQTGEGPGYRIMRDQTAERLAWLLAGRARSSERLDKQLGGVIEQYFVLPEDAANRRIAIKRLQLRLELLHYIDWSSSPPGILDQLQELGFSRRLRSSMDSALQEVGRASRLIEELVDEPVDDVLGAVIVCKGAGRGGKATCKVIDFDTIREAYRTLRRVTSTLLEEKDAPVEHSVRYLRNLEGIASGYAGIIREASRIVTDEVANALVEVNTVKNRIDNIRRLLLTGDLHRMNRLREIVEAETGDLLGRIRREVANTVQEAINQSRQAIALARDGKKDKLKELAISYSFTNCPDGNYHQAAVLYNPLARLLAREEVFRPLMARIAEAERWLDDIQSGIQDLATLIATKGIDPKEAEDLILHQLNELVGSGLHAIEALANAITSIANYYKLYKEQARKVRVEERSLQARIKELESRIEDIKTQITNLMNTITRLAREVTSKDWTRPSPQRVEAIKHELSEIEKRADTLMGLLRRVQELCKTSNILREEALRTCNRELDHLETRARELEERLEDAKKRYNSLITEIQSSVASTIKELERLLVAERNIYLIELQRGRTDARKAIELISQALDKLQRTTRLDTIDDIAMAMTGIEEARRLLEEARATPTSGNTELLLRILDILAKNRRIRLTKLLDLVKKQAGPEGIGALIEDLAELASQLGITLALVIEAEKSGPS